MTNTPIDYQAALDAFRKEEHAPDTPVRNSALPAAPPMIDGYVDYQAAIKTWDREQEGLYKIHLHTAKRNASHDPTYRGAEYEPAF